MGLARRLDWVMNFKASAPAVVLCRTEAVLVHKDDPPPSFRPRLLLGLAFANQLQPIPKFSHSVLQKVGEILCALNNVFSGGVVC